MRKIVPIILLISLSMGYSFGQNITINDVANDIGLITFKDFKNNTESYGTGSLILKMIDSTRGKVFLVTNKHVIPAVTDSYYATFLIEHEIAGKDSFVSIKIPIFQNNGNYAPYVKFASDGADVCVIDITRAYKDYGLLDKEKYLIPYQLLLTQQQMEKMQIGMGKDIYYIGFPNFFFDRRNKFPIVRKGIISSNPYHDYYFSNAFLQEFHKQYNAKVNPRLHGFLIDGSVFGGSSGSLIVYTDNGIRVANNKIYFHPKSLPPFVLGILTDSYFDLDPRDGHGQRVDIGAAISADEIKKTIDLFP